jgi:hypothetical protein
MAIEDVSRDRSAKSSDGHGGRELLVGCRKRKDGVYIYKYIRSSHVRLSLAIWLVNSPQLGAVVP